MAPTTRSGATKSGPKLTSPLNTPKKGGASKSAAASKKRKAPSSPRSPTPATKGPQKKPKITKAVPKPDKGKGKSKEKDEQPKKPQSPTTKALSMKDAQDILDSLNLPGDPFGPDPTRKGSKGKGKSKHTTAAPPVGLGIDFNDFFSPQKETEEWFTPDQETGAERLKQMSDLFTAQGMPMPKSFSPIELGNEHRERRRGGPRASPTEGKGGKRKPNKDAPVPPPAAGPPPGRKNPLPRPPDYSPIAYVPRRSPLRFRPAAPPLQHPKYPGQEYDPFRPHAPRSPPPPAHHQPLYQPSTRTLAGLAPTRTPPRQTTAGGHLPGRPRPQRHKPVQGHPDLPFPRSPSAAATRPGATRQVRFSPPRQPSTSPITPRRFERELRRLQERLVTSPSEVSAIRRARAGAAMEAARARGESLEREAEGWSAERRRRGSRRREG